MDLVNVMMGGEQESEISEPQCLGSDKERPRGVRCRHVLEEPPREQKVHDDSTKYEIDRGANEAQPNCDFRRRLDFNKMLKEPPQPDSFDLGHEESFSLNLRRSKLNQEHGRQLSSSNVVPFSKNASRGGTSRAGEEGKGKELASPSSRSDRFVEIEKH